MHTKEQKHGSNSGKKTPHYWYEITPYREFPKQESESDNRSVG